MWSKKLLNSFENRRRVLGKSQPKLIELLDILNKTKTYDDICPRPAYRFDKKAFSTKENQDAFIFEVNNYAKENIALVTIYIREPFAEEILISEEVTPTELMSDIGGLMGLFMGCSFVSAVEIVYHILKILVSGLCKQNTDSKKPKPRNNSQKQSRSTTVTSFTTQ